SHIPLMIWHPEFSDKQAGTRSGHLTQTPDLMPTFLSLFGCKVPQEVTGASILDRIVDPRNDRAGMILGMFGGPVCVTDGRFTYFRYPWNVDGDGIFEYTLMPCHMAAPFQPDELFDATLSAPFRFTKGMPLLRVPARKDARRPPSRHDVKFPDSASALFDLATDPSQERPIEDRETQTRLLEMLAKELARHDTPPEMYDYYELRR
ncbi:MAG: sulfatase, partial [Roseibium sp.]|nr:sulfatase [Roseibium sp.]